MEADIQRQLAAGEGDPEYWEAVLPRLRIHAAKARLREIKAQMLEERLAAQEEKLDVAAAMGWLDDEEQEMDDNERYDGVTVSVGVSCLRLNMLSAILVVEAGRDLFNQKLFSAGEACSLCYKQGPSPFSLAFVLGCWQGKLDVAV
eukprot:GHUV01028958.1.p1 GENE.GHUV01028958.1~~GHUV01028958.1.p1  ORF type:complete len:146 (+),score=41.31 GHUV01028958.1:195-632(+)